MQVALISPDDDDIKFYLELLSCFKSLKTDVYTNINVFCKKCLNKNYNGVIIDNRLLEDSTALDSLFLFSWDLEFPLLKISRTSDGNDIWCEIHDTPTGGLKGKKLLEHFLSKIN